MVANRYLNKENDLRNRRDHLRNGTLFDAYPYQISYEESGAKKMIVRTTFDGFLGTHVCQYCNTWDPMEPSLCKIGHFKVFVDLKSVPELNGYLSRYTSSVREMMNDLSILSNKKQFTSHSIQLHLSNNDMTHIHHPSNYPHSTLYNHCIQTRTISFLHSTPTSLSTIIVSHTTSGRGNNRRNGSNESQRGTKRGEKGIKLP